MDEIQVPLLQCNDNTTPKTITISHKYHKFAFCLVAFGLLLFYYVIFGESLYDDNHFPSYQKPEEYYYTRLKNINQSTIYSMKNFLVFSDKCKIRNVEPFNMEAKAFHKPLKYVPCRSSELLTFIGHKGNVRTLHIDKKAAASYSKFRINCCYMNITRKTPKGNEDNSFSLSSCVDFKDGTIVTAEYLQVRCSNKYKTRIYENTHFTVPITDKIKQKLENNTTKPYSVLIIGIDSISRLNLIRSMPKTFEYLETNRWSTLKGYNKMGDNTFPNVMAIMTGFNPLQARDVCNPLVLGALDACPFVFSTYRQLGYVTAYAEDNAKIGTFNYKKTGFVRPPWDYYLRPLMLASEKLPSKYVDAMLYCIGPETYGEKILNAAKDFSSTFAQSPHFGFFWMNSFSHQEINSPSRMDAKVRLFLEDIERSGVLNNSIVVFLSDHGIRFGEIRYTRTGWYEERLPYIYISVPKRFQANHPVEYRNLKANLNRLTTPYDLHMTLQHILVLSGLNHSMIPAPGCPNCRSLFSEMEAERSCEDAGVLPHWCTCYGYQKVPASDPIGTKAFDYVIDELASIVKEYKKCVRFRLKKIRSVQVSNFDGKTYYLLMFETWPQAVFEATVSLGSNGSDFGMEGAISRLDSYAWHSACVNHDIIKKYCYCLS